MSASLGIDVPFNQPDTGEKMTSLLQVVTAESLNAWLFLEISLDDQSFCCKKGWNVNNQNCWESLEPFQISLYTCEVEKHVESSWNLDKTHTVLEIRESEVRLETTLEMIWW